MIYFENSMVMPAIFRNVVSVAVVVQKNPDWIDHIIKKYGPCLPQEHYETHIAFARGLYHYSLKSYKEAIRFFLLAEAKEEVIFSAMIRRWQWMSLYECDPYDTDTLLNHLLSFERYLLRNKKEIQHLTKVFNQFIAYATKLVKTNSADADVIHHELMGEEHFPGFIWLTEQLAQKHKTVQRSMRPHSVS